MQGSCTVIICLFYFQCTMEIVYELMLFLSYQSSRRITKYRVIAIRIMHYIIGKERFSIN